jgi:hypothetical protein
MRFFLFDGIQRSTSALRATHFYLFDRDVASFNGLLAALQTGLQSSVAVGADPNIG